MAAEELQRVEVLLAVAIEHATGLDDAGCLDRSEREVLMPEALLRHRIVGVDRRQDLDRIPSSGLAREALTSLYSLFECTRNLLKTAGPGVALGGESLASYALAILNRVLRPFLSRWHPRLSAWEAERSAEVSAFAHEQAWEQHGELRRELAVVRQILAGYSEALALLAGIGGVDEA